MNQDKTMTFLHNCLTSAGATVLLLGVPLIIITLLIGAMNWFETGDPQFQSFLLHPFVITVSSAGFITLFLYGLKTLYGQTKMVNKFEEFKELIKTAEGARK